MTSSTDTIVALVPARGGSKGLPGKNLATVGGSSLVARAVAAARSLPAITEVIVSSDHDAILEEAVRAGATPLRRPAHLAADDTPTDAVARAFVLDRHDVDVLVVLQPTSPLRTSADIDACLQALVGAPAATTVAPVRHPPAWTFRMAAGNRLEPILGWEAVTARRQDAGHVYELTGAVYAVRADYLRQGGRLVGPETRAVVTPPERAVDVDDRVGLQLARALAEDGVIG